MANERAAGKGQEANWRATVEADSGAVGGVKLEAAGAEVAAAMERGRVETLKQREREESERGIAAAREKAGQTIAGITSGSISSPRRASSPAPAARPEMALRSREECEIARLERAKLEKVAKEMADLAATRKQERETSSNPRDLHDMA